jgi:Helix-turn-helix domain of resolvase
MLPGRPSTTENVDIDLVAAMRSEGFSWTAIAMRFGVTTQSLHRCLLSNDFVDTLVSVSNEVVDEAVLEYLKGRITGRGEVLLKGHLRSKGWYVPRQQLRDSITRIDPIGKAERKRKPIRRRVYKVDGPHHLWHIDGHHKLIRYLHTCVSIKIHYDSLD